MPGTIKSPVTGNPKPNNVFFVWYPELCRRSNSTPLAITRPKSKPKCNTVLEFMADRLKYEEWKPLLSALQRDTSLHVIKVKSRLRNYEFLLDVDTEEKVNQMKRKHGALWTAHVMNLFLQALSFSMSRTQVLTTLELDGLPIMFPEYIEDLLSALKGNTTIKCFSLTGCSIKDTGCNSVCLCLQLLPNIETINFSKCDLTSTSGKSIAKLIKFQQLNRYTTSWHKSLRYGEPDAGSMRGIRRITLNCNPKIGDEGLQPILDELEDDLWIAALDMQKCGITEKISQRIIDVVSYNRSLRIVDFRHNNDLIPPTIDKILEVLKMRHEESAPTNVDYQWCDSDLALSSISSTFRDMGTSIDDQAWLTATASTNKISRAKGQYTDTNRCPNVFPNNGKLDKSKKMKLDIHLNPNSNINGSKNYKSKVSRLKYSNLAVDLNHTLAIVMKSLEKFNFINTPSNIKKENISNDQSPIKPEGKTYKRPPSLSSYNLSTPIGNKYLTNKPYIFKNQVGPNVSVANSVSNLFANYCQSQNKGDNENHKVPDDNDDVETLLSYYCGSETVEFQEKKTEPLERHDLSDSQVSLFDYMQELQQDTACRTKVKNPIYSMSKLQCKGTKNGIKRNVLCSASS